MEPFLLLLESWWWAAPAAAGLGAATYSAATARGRRARRLELEAARHEETLAYRGLQAARAATRVARAEVLSARARGGLAAARAVLDAQLAAQQAKRAEKSAALELRASRARVKATAQHLAVAGQALPLDRLFAAHDAVNARYADYQTDPEKVIAFPLLGDAQHPPTLAFLRAQREAQALRPSTARSRVAPPEFIAYRQSVHTLEVAFEVAERSAKTQLGPTLTATPHPRPVETGRPVGERDAAPRTAPWPVPRRDGPR